ncbi:TnsD family Tn7-like transposition protein [Paenibacillus ehimensis]|uniref:TnsD family Tn7-like transposition protein n=1 Tax=Paenibacillus ehimensis TaxID=79264 RepID=UPI002DBDA182|nr:TnsD family Tn7-like transposition protein [Paenibacillus ehimensis]MEC0210983.1 TnsD family Tn7-like transposition protein [Paenibacillus ehimensis]
MGNKSLLVIKLYLTGEQGAADHYKQSVVQKLEMMRCSDTGKPIGIFTCKCGFIFSRRGPDLSATDKERIGKIREYGSIWRNKARQYLNQGLSYRQIAKLLGVDVGTVIKHSRFDDEGNHKKLEKDRNVHASHKRQETRIRPRKVAKDRIDWIHRDQELSLLVARKCKEMLQLEDSKPIRVRFTTVAKKIGMLSLLENQKDKLPMTIAVMNEYIETTEQFQIRRIKWAARKQRGTHP